jgi:hypothetical protein
MHIRMSQLVFSIVFWSAVFVFMYYVTVFHPDSIQKVEPCLMGIAIISTIFFSYAVIFFPDFLSLRVAFLTVPFVGIVLLLGIVGGVILAQMFFQDTMDKYPSGAAISSVMDLWNFLGRDNLELLYSNHALFVVGYLTIIDAIIAVFHVQPERQSHFCRLILIVDAPTLIALATVIIVRDVWVPKWDWPLDGMRFEAGAITFQLLAANIQIVVASALSSFPRICAIQPPDPAAGSGFTPGPDATLRAPRRRDGRGRFV